MVAHLALHDKRSYKITFFSSKLAFHLKAVTVILNTHNGFYAGCGSLFIG
jgi:hypothetical protein